MFSKSSNIYVNRITSSVDVDAAQRFHTPGRSSGAGWLPSSARCDPHFESPGRGSLLWALNNRCLTHFRAQKNMIGKSALQKGRLTRTVWPHRRVVGLQFCQSVQGSAPSRSGLDLSSQSVHGSTDIECPWTEQVIGLEWSAGAILD